MGKSKKHEKKSKKKNKHKHHKEKKEKLRKVKKIIEIPEQKVKEKSPAIVEDYSIPLDLMNSKSHAPETPEEYQKRQSGLRRVTDPVTGRIRLIKGDGEILEEIVSKERHTEINRSATKGDGQYFADNTVGRGRRQKH